MSRRIRHKFPRVVSVVGVYLEHAATHHCRALRQALVAGVYDAVATTATKPRRTVMVVVPNLDDGVGTWSDRVRWCPFCGTRVPLVRIDVRVKSGDPRPVVPDCLPPEVQ